MCSQSFGRSRNGHRHPTAELARRVRQSAPVGNGKILTFTVYATQNVEDEADIVRELNMGDHTVPLLLITANVGSVFENVSKYASNELRACHISNTTLPCQ